MTKTLTRSIAAVLTAATIATSVPLTQASAASAGTPAAKSAVTTDFSARRHYRGAGGAVALGALAIIAGAAIAASQRDSYYDNGYAYAPGPYYYGGPRYYGGYRHWHHHWHR